MNFNENIRNKWKSQKKEGIYLLNFSYRRFSAIVYYLPLHKFWENKFENFSILIFDALFITDLWIIPEG